MATWRKVSKAEKQTDFKTHDCQGSRGFFVGRISPSMRRRERKKHENKQNTTAVSTGSAVRGAAGASGAVSRHAGIRIGTAQGPVIATEIGRRRNTGVVRAAAARGQRRRRAGVGDI